MTPKKDEAKADYLHRYMADAEACRVYPNEQERFERGAALWDHRDTLEAANALGYNSERDGAESYTGRHLQPGVVNYPEMQHPLTRKQGIAILVEKDVIDRMRPTAKGIPVVNWAHDTSGGAERWIADGKAVGVLTRSFWNGDEAWEGFELMLWDREAKANANNGFRVSNAWKEDEIDWTPGVHNGVPYDGRLVAAHYTHLAIVPNPRYEGAVIYANALGGLKAMFKLFRSDKTEAVELPKDSALDIGGKKYQLAEVVNAMTAAEAEKAKITTTGQEGVLGEKDTLGIGDKKYTHAEILNALSLADKAKEKAPVKEAEVKTTVVASAVDLTSPEFINAVEAASKKHVEKLVGEGFFNGIQDLARRRPGQEQGQPVRKTERDRVADGRKRFGKKDKAAA